MECKGIYILKASRVKYLSVKIYQNMKKANGKLKFLYQQVPIFRLLRTGRCEVHYYSRTSIMHVTSGLKIYPDLSHVSNCSK